MFYIGSFLCCSEEEEKGSDCIPQFKAMQECFQKYPELYHDEEGEEEGEGEGEGAENESSEVRPAPETSSSEPAYAQTHSSEQS